MISFLIALVIIGAALYLLQLAPIDDHLRDQDAAACGGSELDHE